MAQIETWIDQDLKKPVKVRPLSGNIFSQDNQGNLIGVNVFDNGIPASLSGTVSANIVRADGATVSAVGSLSGNKCSVVLPQAAYAVPGMVAIAVKLTSGNVVTTVGAVSAVCYRSVTDTAVDPGDILPSIQTLIDQINAAVASIPADYSALWRSFAPTFATGTAYSVGQYVTYNGGLYRFTVDHPAGSWNASHVIAVNVGGELTDLRSSAGTLSSLGLYVSQGYVCQRLAGE